MKLVLHPRQAFPLFVSEGTECNVSFALSWSAVPYTRRSETITWHSLRRPGRTGRFRRFSEFDASRALADDLGLTFADHEIQEMLEDEGDLAVYGGVAVHWQGLA